MPNNNYDNWFKEKGPKPIKPNGPKKNIKRRFSFSKIKKIFKINNKTKKERKVPKTKFGKFLRTVENQIRRGIIFIQSNIAKVFNNFTKKPLLKKIMYTILIILIFRIAASITTPGVIVNKKFGSDSGSFIGIMDMMGGGTLRNFSIVALGLTPYITASIFMMVLQSEAFPPIYRLARSGPKGKRKINIITRCITFVLAITTSITLIQQFTSSSMGMLEFAPGFDKNIYKFFILPTILIGGSMFTLFLGEQITEKGVGNGTSLIIFSGIAIRMPAMFRNAWIELVGSAQNQSTFVGIMNFIIYTVVFFILLFAITYFYKAERHIPIQQTGAGMTTDAKQMSRLPLKVNPGGVIPIMFAMMIVALPLQVVQFFDHQNDGRIWIEHNLRLTAPLGIAIMCVIIFLLTIAMSFFAVNPMTIAENFKKNGTFIPGIKPGDETEKYLSHVLVRLSIFSGMYLTIITIVKYIQQIIGLSRVITYGGTSMIILVSVAVETISQLKAREQTQKIAAARVKSSGSSGQEGVKGLLW